MFYFDTLPIHFPPKRLESLSSYLARLARANLLTEPCQMNYLIGPGKIGGKYIQRMDDYPPIMVENMVWCTGQSSETLLSTTFYPIAVNLGRNPHPQAIGRFLKGSIAGYLRYCPKCLEEDPYYRLPWRFVSLKICPEHACMIQERCPACGKPLPLVAPGFQVNMCASCGQILSDSPTELSGKQDDLRANRLFFNDLDGLLSIPTPLPEIGQRAAVIGSALRRIRQNLDYGLTYVSVQTGFNISALAALEAGNPIRSCGTFQQMKAYTDLLNIPLCHLLVDENPGENQSPLIAQSDREVDRNKSSSKRKTKFRKLYRIEDLPAKIEEAIEALRQTGDPITRKNVCKYLGLRGIAPHGDPEVVAMLKKVQQERAKQTKRVMLEEERSLFPVAKRAVDMVIESEGYLRLAAFCKAMGMSLKQLRRYPKIARLIDLQKTEERSRRRSIAPEDVIKRIENLKAAHQTPSQVSVANALKVSPSLLKKKPELRQVLVSYGLVCQPTRSNAQNSITA